MVVATSRIKARSGRAGADCRGATIAEVLVVTGILAILAALLLPVVQTVREKSRQVTCRNNLRQLVLANEGHHAARGAFPVTSVVSGDIVDGAFRTIYASVSPHRSLLAYLDAGLFGKLDFNDLALPVEDAPPGTTNSANEQLMRTSIPVFLCPSDRMPVGGNNYRANMGTGPGIYSPTQKINAVGLLDPGNRSGAWVNGNALRPQDFKDGLSHTIIFSEKLIGDGDREKYTPYRDRFGAPFDVALADDVTRVCRDYATATPAWHDSFAGTTWLFGGWNHTWYNHVATPNSRTPDCSTARALGGGNGLYAARSLHPGGVHVAFGDGAVKFYSDHVDLAVWRALATRAGSEQISD